jgi:hypothetical protein
MIKVRYYKDGELVREVEGEVDEVIQFELEVVQEDDYVDHQISLSDEIVQAIKEAARHCSEGILKDFQEGEDGYFYFNKDIDLDGPPGTDFRPEFGIDFLLGKNRGVIIRTMDGLKYVSEDWITSRARLVPFNGKRAVKNSPDYKAQILEEAQRRLHIWTGDELTQQTLKNIRKAAYEYQQGLHREIL